LVPFQLFGPSHLIVMVLTILVAYVSVRLVRMYPFIARPLTRILAATILVNLAVGEWHVHTVNHWELRFNLPFQMCDWAFMVMAIAAFLEFRWAYDLSYYMGLTWVIQAWLTPDISYDFPDFWFVNLFLGHALALVLVAIYCLGMDRRPRRGSPVRSFILNQLLIIFVGTFNWQFHTNYMFLSAKPAGQSLMDLLGPWPTYVFWLHVYFASAFAGWSIPWWLKDRKAEVRA
jgi:hypothetical integral membrane protein (TIGR02206 family)